MKPPLKTTKEGVNNTATAKASPDGQSWRRLKRIANGFWKHVSLNCRLFVASSGFSRPDATLRRERNRCEHPSASLIEPPPSAMDVWKQVKALAHLLTLTIAALMRACCGYSVFLWIIYSYLLTLSNVGKTQMELNSKGPYSSSRAKRKINFVVACLRYP